MYTIMYTILHHIYVHTINTYWYIRAAVSSVSVSAATRLACGIYLGTCNMYTDLTVLFSSEVYDLFQLLCALSLFLFVFPS